MPEMPAGKSRPLLFWLVLAGGVIALDQASKLMILATFRQGEFLPLTGFFNLVLAFNPGAAFSFLADAGGWQKWLFTLLALAVSAWIIQELRQHPEQGLVNFALSLVMGGAIGNVIDRIAYGAVVDFLDFYLGTWHWPAFNVADAAICAGVGLLLWGQLRESMRREPIRSDVVKADISPTASGER